MNKNKMEKNKKRYQSIIMTKNLKLIKKLWKLVKMIIY